MVVMNFFPIMAIPLSPLYILFGNPYSTGVVVAPTYCPAFDITSQYALPLLIIGGSAASLVYDQLAGLTSGLTTTS